MLNLQNITALRMQRQHLINKATEAEYDELFRSMSPVPTEFWCCPGDPPSMYFRTDFNDFEYNQKRRAKRDIVKGRFQNGSIAYIEKNELELFAAIYKKPVLKLSQVQMELMELLNSEGPMNIKLMKEITGLLVKTITPDLHRLQQAFIVYEDQVDNEWDRGWYMFDKEFPDINLDKYTGTEALKAVLPRFSRLNVLFDADMAKSFYKVPAKYLNTALEELIKDGKLVIYNNGYMLESDYKLFQTSDHDIVKSVFVLHRNDFLVKSNEHLLKEKYINTDLDVLQYILLDGDFKGVVIGHFKNGPFVIEDIVLDMPDNEIAERKDEIIDAVYMVNSREASPIKRFNGKDI